MVNGARAKLLFICQSKYNKGPRSASPPSLILALALAESGTAVGGRTAACDRRGRNVAGTGQRNEPHAYGHKVDTTHIDTQTHTGYGKNLRHKANLSSGQIPGSRGLGSVKALAVPAPDIHAAYSHSTTAILFEGPEKSISSQYGSVITQIQWSRRSRGGASQQHGLNITFLSRPAGGNVSGAYFHNNGAMRNDIPADAPESAHVWPVMTDSVGWRDE
ncbi:hypothetical protein EYF80_014615 [Liparis tanakae]|uniref:Uncharacterized protein n=1 Tax=Liparis tanakae TaxID=230148 RepID=A0A4Z2ICJ0_9TELE|nr:hypothetical protein EYF80_014615 [Liparis tanakae]